MRLTTGLYLSVGLILSISVNCFAANREGSTPVGRVKTTSEVKSLAEAMEKEGKSAALIKAVQGDLKEGSSQRKEFDSALERLKKANSPHEKALAERAYHEELHKVLDTVSFTAKSGGGFEISGNSEMAKLLSSEPTAVRTLNLGDAAVAPRLAFDRMLVRTFSSEPGIVEAFRDHAREMQRDHAATEADNISTLEHMAKTMKGVREGLAVSGEEKANLDPTERALADGVIRAATENDLAAGAVGKAARNNFDALLGILMTPDKIERKQALEGVKLLHDEYAKQMRGDVEAMVGGKLDVEGVNGAKLKKALEGLSLNGEGGKPKTTAELIKEVRERMERDGFEAKDIEAVLRKLRDRAGEKIAEEILKKAKELKDPKLAEEFLCQRPGGQPPCLDGSLITGAGIVAAAAKVGLPGFNAETCNRQRAAAFNPSAAGHGAPVIPPAQAAKFGNKPSGDNHKENQN